MDGLVAQGAALLDVLEQTKNLSAREPQPEVSNGAPPVPKVAPPPDMAMLRDISSWNDMKK